MTFDHVFADLGGVPANRLTDPQGIAGLLLAAANAAGLNPASPPVVTLGRTARDRHLLAYSYLCGCLPGLEGAGRRGSV